MAQEFCARKKGLFYVDFGYSRLSDSRVFLVEEAGALAALVLLPPTRNAVIWRRTEIFNSSDHLPDMINAACPMMPHWIPVLIVSIHHFHRPRV